MTGVIWFVQVIHYPLFGAVGEADFDQYAAMHVKRTGWVVGPAMLVELGATVGVTAHGGMLAMIGAGLLGLIWAATFGLSVPCHHRLARGFDPGVHHRLVVTNWLRTGLWSVRGVVAGVLLLRASM